MRKILLGISLLLLAAVVIGCGTPTPATTPVIVVVTATPDSPVPAAVTTGAAGTSAPSVDATLPAGDATVSAGDSSTTPTAAGTPDPTWKTTTVKFVKAVQDINIRNGPNTDAAIVGGVYAGQTANVTGYQSADGKWWQVECPVTSATTCWVSADPALTTPADTENDGPTPTTTTEVNAEGFVRQLAKAVEDKDYDTLKTLMDDPFTLTAYLSEGTTPTRDQAITQLQSNLLGPSDAVVVDLADKTDQKALLNGTDPLSMWGSGVKVIKTIYVTGLGADKKDDALLAIAQHSDNSLSWYGLLYAKNGFASYPH